MALKNLVDPIARAEFGDPVNGTTAYSICIYDAAKTLVGTMEVARAGATCPIKPCWKTSGATGFKYTDKTLAASGIGHIQLKAGSAGKGKVVVTGKNDLPDGKTALPVHVASRLTGNREATVQVLTSDAGCFGAVLPNVDQADGSVFKAETP